MNRLAVFAAVLTLMLWPLGLVSGQATAPTAVQPVPTVVQVPTPTPEPIGPNTTTLGFGGILLAGWEFFRRVILPRILPGPTPDPVPPPTPLPPGPSPSNQLLELLRLILERLLQPQPMPLMQAVPAATIRVGAEAGLPQKAPDWAQALLEEIRALRKPAA